MLARIFGGSSQVLFPSGRIKSNSHAAVLSAQGQATRPVARAVNPVGSAQPNAQLAGGLLHAFTQTAGVSNQGASLAASPATQAQALKAKLARITVVFRDLAQGRGNRIPLNHPLALQMYSLIDQLNAMSHPGQEPIVDAIEHGGASVQVDTFFLRNNPTKTLADMRAAARNTWIRTLWRGVNGYSLEPGHNDDLGFQLEHIAKVAAPIGAKAGLIIKVFDSQAETQNLEFTAQKVAQLIAKGHPLKIEFAIPFSDDSDPSGDPYTDPAYAQKFQALMELAEKYGLDANDVLFHLNASPFRGNRQMDLNNPYTDAFFEKKVSEALDLAIKYKIPAHLVYVSLKDMIGKLPPTRVNTLVPKLVAIKNAKLPGATLAYHGHDTGFTSATNRAFIQAAGDGAVVDAVGSIGGIDGSGFDNLRQLVRDARPDATPEQLKIIDEIEAVTQQLCDLFAATKPAKIFTGEQLRDCNIPGGGGASFDTAVRQTELAKQLNWTENQVVLLTGIALKPARKMSGYASQVTPGFLRMQEFAILLVAFLIKEKLLKPGMGFEDAQKVVLTPLTDDQVVRLVQTLNPTLKEFLRGEMPGPVHPMIRAMLGQRTGVSNAHLSSQLAAAKLAVEAQGICPIRDSAQFDAAVFEALVVGPRNWPISKAYEAEPSAAGLTKDQWRAQISSMMLARPGLLADEVRTRDYSSVGDLSVLREVARDLRGPTIAIADTAARSSYMPVASALSLAASSNGVEQIVPMAAPVRRSPQDLAIAGAQFKATQQVKYFAGLSPSARQAQLALVPEKTAHSWMAHAPRATKQLASTLPRLAGRVGGPAAAGLTALQVLSQVRQTKQQQQRLLSP